MSKNHVVIEGDLLVKGEVHTTGSVYAFSCTDPSSQTESVFQLGADTRICIDEDFTMSGGEFKTCMRLIRKMALKECPEEFI